MATHVLPPPQVTENADGSKTIVSFRLNDAGRKVKVTKKIRDTLKPATEASTVSDRRAWARYGLSKNDKPENFKPEFSEEVVLRLQSKNQKAGAKEEQQESAPKKQSVMSSIKCRLCGGPHFSRECPYQGMLGGVSQDGAEGAADGPGGAGMPGAPGPGGPVGAPGKYTPPSLRGVPGVGLGPGMGGRMDDERDESLTLRVSNIPENVQDQILRDYFSRAGPVTRCHVARDRETGQGRGFAFVSFSSQRDAQKAQEMFNGQPAGHLIMHVEFAKKAGPPRRF